MYEILCAICPYSYEVIEILLLRMEKLAANNQELIDLVEELQNIIKFLKLTDRQNGFTQTEIEWYQSRIKEPHAPVDRALTPEISEISLNVTSHSRVSMASMAELVSFQISSASILPPLAKKRLPYQVFLIQEKELIEKIITPIVHNELSVYNVQVNLIVG